MDVNSFETDSRLRLELDPAPWSSLAPEVSLAEVEQDFVGEHLDGSLRGGWQGQGYVQEVSYTAPCTPQYRLNRRPP